MTNESLSDKISVETGYNDKGYVEIKTLKAEDVRSAVKKFLDEINKFGTHNTGVHAGYLQMKAKEIFGGELVK